MKGLRDRIARALGRTAGQPIDRTLWERSESLLAGALDLPSAGRAAFLDRACAGDAELRREVESLLAAHETPALIDRPAIEQFEALLTPTLPALAPGTVVSHYRIVEPLGGGGMGIVYQARDVRLDRTVALKFLHPSCSADVDAKRRFVIEAQAAAALDHPNVCTIHEIGETDDGRLFIAMPCYEGETLKARRASGPLSVDDALGLTIQVAHGLAEAHEHGIVHRDIKPANLMITSAGVVKILDFGVAKLAGVTVTGAGLTPGTIAYMSPEQLAAETVDGRSDIWSLGVVLYELLAGVRPFRGEDQRAVRRAILDSDPEPLGRRRPDLPAGVDRVIRTMLARSPAQRFASARELIAAIERVRGVGSGPSASRPSGLLPEGERRHASIVVARLGDYARLLETLTSDELEQVGRGITTEARDIADKHGGTLNSSAGPMTVMLFGISAAHEDDCQRAVRAALELRDRVSALNAEIQSRTGQPIRLQLGVETGQLAVQLTGGRSDEYRVAGAVMQAAESLAARAAPDEIWVTAECRRLVGPLFDAEPRDSHALRPGAEPASLFAVIGPSGLQTRLEAAEKSGLTGYTGRDEELRSLRRRLDEMLRRDGQLVTVIGEAGVGKSRLLLEFCQHIDRDTVALLQGRCQSYGSEIAYLPFIEILRRGLRLGQPAAGQSEAEELVSRVREAGPELEHLIPLYLHLLSLSSDDFPVPTHLQGEEFRLRIQEALVALVTVRARRQPTVMVLEDWHWADETSHAVLKQLAETVAGYPLLVVVTCRPGYLTDWDHAGQLTAIQLRPLDPDESLAMLKAALHADRVPDELSGLIYERTGGNPFFLEEVCQTLLEAGTVRIEGREVLLSGPLESLDLPETVQAVIGTRLDRLDREAREAIRAASVIGREFTWSLLERTLGGERSLSTALQTLKGSGLIQQIQLVPEPAYRFKHVLTQEVAYAGLLERQCKELHGRVGSAIEQMHGERLHEHLDRLADHFGRAEEWRKAAEYGIGSADRARALGQFAEALRLAERAQECLLHLPPGPAEADLLVEILLRQERLCETLGRRERQQRIIDELVALLEPAGHAPKLAEAYLRQGDVFTLLRRFDEAHEALRRSLGIRRELGDTVGERNTLRSLGLLRWHEGRNDEARLFIEQALQIDRGRHDRLAVVGDLANMGPVLKGLGQYQQARAYLEEALSLSEQSPEGGDPDGAASELLLKRSYILQNLANIHREMGETERALEYLYEARALTTEKRMPIERSYHLTAIAHIHLQQGRIEESLHQYREAVELTRRARFVPGLVQSLRILGEVLVGLERGEEARPLLEEASGLFNQLGDVAAEAEVWSTIAQVHEREARHASALAAWGRARTLQRNAGNGRGELQAVEGTARVTRRMTDPALALAHYREAVELASMLGDGAAEGRLHNTIGILEWTRGDYEQALKHYERGLALCRELGESANGGVLLNSIGVTLAALGRRDEARLQLEQAVALHRQSGQARLEGHALAALGDLWTADGDGRKAAEHYEQSLQLRLAIGDRRGEGWMLHRLAQAQLLNGFAPEAEQLTMGAARIAAECGDAELSDACVRARRATVH